MHVLQSNGCGKGGHNSPTKDSRRSNRDRLSLGVTVEHYQQDRLPVATLIGEPKVCQGLGFG